MPIHVQGVPMPAMAARQAKSNNDAQNTVDTANIEFHTGLK
jgi:hypothetical protein